MSSQWSLEDEEKLLPQPVSRLQKMRWIALIFSTTIALGIVLVALRLIRNDDSLLFKSKDHQLTGLQSVYDARFGWRNVPNLRAKTYGKPLTINSKGLRDRELAYVKASEVRRILVLGDSYVWGYGVADDETFVKVLERRLRQNDSRWEAINAGVAGWGTDQEYLFLCGEGFRYDPDIVVVAVFLGNDPDNILFSKEYGLNKPVFMDYGLSLANVPVPTPGMHASRMQSPCHPFNLMVTILSAMAENCRQHGSRLVVMKFGLFLPKFQDPRTVMFDRKLASWAAQTTSLDYVDVDEALADRQLTTTQLLEGNHDGHWNAFGHRQVADILFQALQRFELLEAQTPAGKP